ncbi:hypothetical protein CASFOL_009363 [Castilleja foliolosa]|uniref:Uncharacterized protein n=1 Tax=Castilleja foliolosa TaxID=1961234 RepID=A0ABD3E137_9LAMI
MASANDNNNMAIEVYQPSQVGRLTPPTLQSPPTLIPLTPPTQPPPFPTTIMPILRLVGNGDGRFDPHEDCDIPTDGVYRKLIDPENIFSKKEQGDEWETFPWGAYTFQILMIRMKNAKVKPQDNYHIYGFSHAFMHFIVEAVPGLADIITSKPKHKCVQPRLLKRLFKKKPLADYLIFLHQQDIQCYEKLEPTKQKLIDYTWWHHVDDDVRSSVKYIHRESKFLVNAKETPLKRTREQSPVPARGHGYSTRSPDNSVPAEEVRPQKRARTTKRPNVDSSELLTRGYWRGASRKSDDLRSEMREIEERESRKSDDLKSEIEKLKKRWRSCSGITIICRLKKIIWRLNHLLLQDKHQQKTPPPPAEQDDLYVPFDGNFIDEIEAFADKDDFVRCRGVGEPESTPIRRIPVTIGKYLTPIKVSRRVVKKHQAKTPLLIIRRANRPPKDSDAMTYIIDWTSKHMSAYIAYLESDSEEARDIGTGMLQYEKATYFKKVEDPNSWMDIQMIDAYLRILHLSHEFSGSISESIYHENKASLILSADKGQMEKLNPEDASVQILESWAPLVPITAVDKIYVVWYFAEHIYPLVIDLVKCEVWIINSLSNNTTEAKRVTRYDGTLCLRHILPAILQLSGFYDERKDLKPVNREWDLRFADKEQCFFQTDVMRTIFVQDDGGFDK